MSACYCPWYLLLLIKDASKTFVSHDPGRQDAMAECLIHLALSSLLILVCVLITCEEGLAWSGHSGPLIFTYFYDVYWFMAALAPHYRAQAFSRCSDWGYISFSRCSGSSCCAARARGECGLWFRPSPDQECNPCPCDSRRFLTTGPQLLFMCVPAQTTWHRDLSLTRDQV